MSTHSSHRPPISPSLPTHADIYATLFSSSLLDPLPNDLAPWYHTPNFSRSRGRSHHQPNLTPTSTIILSITPTPSFYHALHSPPRPRNPLCFLRRPWTLDRRSLPHDAAVLASHTSFDAHLTVGWNPLLARRLGFSVTAAQQLNAVAAPGIADLGPEAADPDRCMCVRGYKGDPDRRIGLLARAAKSPQGRSYATSEVVRRIRCEYPGTDLDVFEHGAGTVRVMAIMNAFGAEEVQRVEEMVKGSGWTQRLDEVLYLTGQVREAGLDAARRSGMPVICVGHRVCEEWGITAMAERLRERHPGVMVQVVLEDEVEAPRAEKQMSTAAQVIISN